MWPKVVYTSINLRKIKFIPLLKLLDYLDIILCKIHLLLYGTSAQDEQKISMEILVFNVIWNLILSNKLHIFKSAEIKVTWKKLIWQFIDWKSTESFFYPKNDKSYESW